MGFFIVDEDRCLNYNYKKTECHNCREVCPQHCWEDDRVFPERCDGCGLCQAVCPVDAIGVEGIFPASWSAMTDRREGDISLSCRRHGTGPWSCLGFLNARDMVALALSTKGTDLRDISLFVSRCRECKPAVDSHLNREIRAANRYLARFGKDRVLMSENPPPPENNSQAINRRAFFSSLLSTGIETARNALWPDDAVVSLPKAYWRSQALRGVDTGDSNAPQDLFPNLAVAQECIACGLCAKICIVQAVTALENETGMELWHEPMLCTGCGLCAAHCPVGCVTLNPGGRAGKHLLAMPVFPCCNECGKPFKPAGQQLTCFECLLKGRQSIFGP